MVAQEEKEFPKVLTFKEKIGYALGDFGNTAMFDMGQLFLLKYMTDVAHLPAASAGLVFLIAKVWDAFADIGVGTAIDQRSKIGPRGRFRPFILWSAVPLGLLLIANFTIPDFSLNGRMAWAYITYILFGTVYSICNIAYGSMQPTMTKNNDERAVLSSWRSIAASFSDMISAVAFMPIVLMMPEPKIGYTVAASIFAFGGVVSVLTCYALIKERYEDEKARKKELAETTDGKKTKFREVLKEYKALFHNGPLLVACLANLAYFSAFNVKQAVQFYFAQYNLHNISIVTYMSFITVPMSIIGTAVTPWFTKKLGKKQTFILGAVIWAISDGIGYFVVHSAISYTIFTSISYFGNGLINGLTWSIISDIVEYGEWKTGIRTEGITYSAYTYFRKLSQAAAGYVPGVILAAVGYIPNQAQTARALAGIRGLVFLYPVIMAVLTVIFMLMYKLSDKRVNQIMIDLANRHAQLDQEK